ncbi:hypothetical protein FA10DRAFT_269329 [Acaromyces ingoldii]|uniref:Zn(2)-C6 fungal-type domain-containing protein n=1 Tax=Acaromyces ingoldii TaxID=215250 RepID=A0A316YGY9_9BASI|nr:hypothetical protein FA10DRAFT_269329 [Acaromyces ingoldii]PWN87373.1 hypothetical protein FA10DRAFT_269329 [Acaromyces ingoldii]
MHRRDFIVHLCRSPTTRTLGNKAMAGDDSRSPSGSGDASTEQQQKVRRRRNAISCLECRSRKIKCDRNVPGCSSCVARGIRHKCRWGDERDDLELNHQQGTDDDRGNAAGKKRARDGGDGQEGDVDRIVSEVLKRLRGSSASSQDAESSIALAAELVRGEKRKEEILRDEKEEKSWVSESWTYGQPHPQPGTNARSEPVAQAAARPNLVSAFDGFAVADMRGGPNALIKDPVGKPTVSGMVPAGIQLATSEEDFTELVDSLPMMRAPLDDIVDFFLEHIEPSLGAFNRVVLRNHVDLFWSCVTALRSSMMTTNSATKKRSSSSSSRNQSTTSYGGNTTASASKPGILGSMGFSVTPSSDGSASSPDTHGHPAGIASTGLESPTRLGLVALMLVIVAASCDKITKAEVIARRIFPHTYDESQVPQRKEAILNLAMRFLAQSNYLQQPTLWTLQTITCAKFNWFDKKMMSTCTIWNTMAIRIAQSMGLHRLGSAIDDVRTMRRTGHASCTEEEDEKNDGNAINMEFDPLSGHSWARKWHKASVSLFERDSLSMRELGRKVWNNLTCHDWIFASHMDHAYSVTTNKTSLPLCMDDEDVVYRLHTMEEGEIKKRVSFDLPSENSYILCFHQIARIIRELVDLEEELEADFSFKETCIISDKLRAVLSGLPPYFRFDGVCELTDEVRRQHADRPYLSLQRVLLHEQVHTRLLRLHRNHIGRGLRDEAYVDSVSSCAEAASVVVTVRDELERVQSPMRNMGFFKAHLFQAVLVIQIILMWATSIRPYDSATDDHQKRLWLSLNLARLASDMDKCIEYLRGESIVESPMRIIEALAKKLRFQLESSVDKGATVLQAPSHNGPSAQPKKDAMPSPGDAAGMYQAHWLSAQPNHNSSMGVATPVDEGEAALDRFLAGFVVPVSQQQPAAPRFEQSYRSMQNHQQHYQHHPTPHDTFGASSNLADTSFLDTMFPQYAENGTDLLGALESALYAFGDGSAPQLQPNTQPLQPKEVPLLP